ncbi:MBL fold metallo-hydrolase [Geomicrobium sp. JCM 19038]|uniref:MBL fold metallo-hydrolase n=1 Tax=Geomicrobium sp. JCM 19038 TaxID=1460635 RepID=UPI00045F2A34|nr:MBL fold metallo-hydrolase [Geomicrobium sp. JCM 19038]GAK06795.1 beta-lactamase [Geomicrobium sp. JCM 19038]
METINTLKIGSIEVIPGEKGSRVPFSTTIAVIDDQKRATLIDAGAGKRAFQYINEQYEVEDILLTHFHIDHTWGIPYFKDANVKVNWLDHKKMVSIEELMKTGGNYAIYGASGIKAMIETPDVKRFEKIIDRQKHVYPYDETFNVSGTRVEMIHTPGHCESFCCPYFPDEGVIVVGDYDLTSFGPWYNNADSNIDEMLESADKTLAVNAEHFVTLHHKGVFTRKEYEEQLEAYMNIIFKREKKLKQLIDDGVPTTDIHYQELFYRRKNLDQAPSLIGFEKIGIAKHLERLQNLYPVYKEYYEQFVQEEFKAPEFVHYSHR